MNLYSALFFTAFFSFALLILFVIVGATNMGACLKEDEPPLFNGWIPDKIWYLWLVFLLAASVVGLIYLKK